MSVIEPRMGPESYKTYAIHSPLATHWRPASCEEVGCIDFLKGWRTRVEGLAPEVLHAVRHQSGRKFTELPVVEGETWLVFEAGQPCWRASLHRLPTGRPELYVVRDGDRRGNPRGTKDRVHLRPELWQEDFAEHQQGLADAIQEG
jgi:hypothetical protein